MKKNHKQTKPKLKQNDPEEFMIILDSFTDDKKIICYFTVGCKHYDYFSIILKKDISVSLLEKVYVGSGVRDKVHHIKNKVKYSDMTPKAQSNLKDAFYFEKIEDVLKGIVNVRGLKLLEEFNSKGKHILLLNGVIPRPMREEIEDKIKEITGKECEIRSQMGMMMETGILKGRNFQH